MVAGRRWMVATCTGTGWRRMRPSSAVQRALTRSLGVAWGEADRWGNRELAGMPQDLLRVFSKRADAIDGEVERLQAEGRLRTPKLVKWVVQATRQAKQHEATAALAEQLAGADRTELEGLTDRFL